MDGYLGCMHETRYSRPSRARVVSTHSPSALPGTHEADVLGWAWTLLLEEMLTSPDRAEESIINQDTKFPQ